MSDTPPTGIYQCQKCHSTRWLYHRETRPSLSRARKWFRHKVKNGCDHNLIGYIAATAIPRPPEPRP